MSSLSWQLKSVTRLLQRQLIVGSHQHNLEMALKMPTGWCQCVQPLSPAKRKKMYRTQVNVFLPLYLIPPLSRTEMSARLSWPLRGALWTEAADSHMKWREVCVWWWRVGGGIQGGACEGEKGDLEGLWEARESCCVMQEGFDYLIVWKENCIRAYYCGCSSLHSHLLYVMSGLIGCISDWCNSLHHVGTWSHDYFEDAKRCIRWERSAIFCQS